MANHSANSIAVLDKQCRRKHMKAYETRSARQVVPPNYPSAIIMYLSLSLYIYIYIYIERERYYIYIYIYVERERERERREPLDGRPGEACDWTRVKYNMIQYNILYYNNILLYIHRERERCIYRCIVTYQ